MHPFQFKCRAKNLEHSSRYANDNEPRHPPKLSECAGSMRMSVMTIACIVAMLRSVGIVPQKSSSITRRFRPMAERR